MVDGPVVCVITRFGLRHPWQLLPMFLDYRRVLRDARRAGSPGLLRGAFLIENLRACYSVSIWRDIEAIPHFGTDVPRHVEVARGAFGRFRYERGRGPELWSTTWKLTSISNNLNWDDFDLRNVLSDVRPPKDEDHSQGEGRMR